MGRGLVAVAVAAVVAVLPISGCAGDDETQGANPERTTTSVRDHAEAWQHALDRQRAWYGSPGAVAAVRLGGERWSDTSGTADLDGTPLTADSRFRIASITKPIVAALVLQAVDRGELALDDPVEELVPGLLRDGSAVTLRMLLDHTSGIFAEGDEGDLMADIGRLADPDLREEASSLAARFLAGDAVVPPVPLLVALAETHDRYAPPGEGYHYSNINYHVAAMALERATGASLAELVQSRLVEPLGLRRTTIAPHDPTEPELRGYTPSATDGELVDPGNAHLLLLGEGGSGGVISTADELLTILQAIVSGSLVPEPLVHEMLRPTAQSATQAYGLGIATYSLSCGAFYGHEGTIDGTGAIAIVSPSGDDGVVVALSGRGPTDPRLAAFADTVLCGDA